MPRLWRVPQHILGINIQLMLMTCSLLIALQIAFMLKASLLLLHQLQFLIQLPDSSAASCIPWTMAVCHFSVFRLHVPSLRLLLLLLLMALMLLS